MAGKKMERTQINKEAKNTSFRGKAKNENTVSAILSLTIIFPKKREGVKVTKRKTKIIGANHDKFNSALNTYRADIYCANITRYLRKEIARNFNLMVEDKRFLLIILIFCHGNFIKKRSNHRYIETRKTRLKTNHKREWRVYKFV
jgi:hypothetical protein